PGAAQGGRTADDGDPLEQGGQALVGVIAIEDEDAGAGLLDGARAGNLAVDGQRGVRVVGDAGGAGAERDRPGGGEGGAGTGRAQGPVLPPGRQVVAAAGQAERLAERITSLQLQGAGKPRLRSGGHGDGTRTGVAQGPRVLHDDRPVLDGGRPGEAGVGV